MCSIVIVLGVGLADSVVDMMVLTNRIAPPENRVSPLVDRMLGLKSEAARALQWISLYGFIWTHLAELGRLLEGWKKTAWAITLAS